jgi:hypothetical protein
MKLPIQDGRLTIGGKVWELEHPVLEACKIQDRVIVIFDYMQYPKDEQAKNLVAFDLQQNRLWTADHPGPSITDTYVGFMSEQPLRVSNFAGINCKIDPVTGALLDTMITK